MTIKRKKELSDLPAYLIYTFILTLRVASDKTSYVLDVT